MATKRGSIETIRMLIQLGYDVNAEKSNGVTACGIAAHCGNLEALKVLVEEGGANIGKTNTRGLRTIHLAIKSGHQECIQYLLGRGILDMYK